MFQYFYFITLLLCIKWVFSYEHDAIGPVIHRLGKHGKKIRSEKRRDNIWQYTHEKGPVQFDVASFIQSNDSPEDEDEGLLQNGRRRRISKNNDYSSLLSLNMNDGDLNRDESQDYINLEDPRLSLSQPLLNLSPPLLKDSLNIKNLKLNGLDNQNSKYDQNNYKSMYKNPVLLSEPKSVHSPEKKCALKSIKFPFFSHNKTDSSKPKKPKKRKLFSFNYPKKVSSPSANNANKLYENTPHQYKTKRSYKLQLCPVCKKRYVNDMKINNRCKKTPKKIFHNSRQFYQFPYLKLEKDRLKRFYSKGLEEKGSLTRRKREDDRDRQLKLLEEIQRKIDNVKIAVPK